MKKDLFGDVRDFTGKGWYYSQKVKEHFLNPKNILLEEPKRGQFNAVGVIGAPACGDVMEVWLKVVPKTEKIKECKWKTFGCASAIASTSIMSVMVTEKGGMTLEKARKITPSDIMKRLGGLPLRKVHCSVLGDKALRKAINNYYYETGQPKKVEKESSRVVDWRLNITEADIEEAVAAGARTLKDVQARLKVGAGLGKESQAEIDQLVRFYIDQHK